MQETWLWSLVWESPTCCGATKPMSHNCWGCLCCGTPKLQLLSPSAATTEACMPLRARTAQEKPLQCEAHATIRKKSEQQQRPSTAPSPQKRKEKPPKALAIYNTLIFCSHLFSFHRVPCWKQYFGKDNQVAVITLNISSGQRDVAFVFWVEYARLGPELNCSGV